MKQKLSGIKKKQFVEDECFKRFSRLIFTPSKEIKYFSFFSAKKC